MEITKQKIILAFKEKGSDLSTNDIASSVYDEYSILNQKQDIESKRKLAKLHRKLLHHINRLIEEGILRVCKYGEKGKKIFCLNIDEGEEITELTPKYKKRMIIAKPSIPILPIEGYEKQGIVIKYQEVSWIERLNSVLISCDIVKDIFSLRGVIEKTFSVVNDSICLDNFEEILMKNKKESVIAFLEKINSECDDYGKIINCIVDISKIKQDFVDILEEISKPNVKNIIFIYRMDRDEIHEQLSVLKKIVYIYLKNKKTIYINNKRVQRSPFFIGNAGPYCISEREWLERKKTLCIACSQSSLVVDVDKFYSLYGFDFEKFSQLMINISKSFLSSNTIQRKNSGYYFRDLVNLKGSSKREFMQYSKNYIRLWNFGISQPDLNPDIIINMISEAKKKINEFTRAEETIYNSCGMPIKFGIAISCAYENSVKSMSNAKYKKLEIKNLEDIYSPKLKKEIIDREKITDLFDGGNEVTFYRVGGNFDPDKIIKEIAAIVGTYDIPLFSYDFSNVKGDMKLTSFFES